MAENSIIIIKNRISLVGSSNNDSLDSVGDQAHSSDIEDLFDRKCYPLVKLSVPLYFIQVHCISITFHGYLTLTVLNLSYELKVSFLRSGFFPAGYIGSFSKQTEETAEARILKTAMNNSSSSCSFPYRE